MTLYALNFFIGGFMGNSFRPLTSFLITILVLNLSVINSIGAQTVLVYGEMLNFLTSISTNLQVCQGVTLDVYSNSTITTKVLENNGFDLSDNTTEQTSKSKFFVDYKRNLAYHELKQKENNKPKKLYVKGKDNFEYIDADNDDYSFFKFEPGWYKTDPTQPIDISRDKMKENLKFFLTTPYSRPNESVSIYAIKGENPSPIFFPGAPPSSVDLVGQKTEGESSTSIDQDGVLLKEAVKSRVLDMKVTFLSPSFNISYIEINFLEKKEVTSSSTSESSTLSSKTFITKKTSEKYYFSKWNDTLLPAIDISNAQSLDDAISNWNSSDSPTLGENSGNTGTIDTATALPLTGILGFPVASPEPNLPVNTGTSGFIHPDIMLSLVLLLLIEGGVYAYYSSRR